MKAQFLLVCLLCVAATCMAQIQMVIQMKDGSSQTISVSEIDSIYWKMEENSLSEEGKIFGQWEGNMYRSFELRDVKYMATKTILLFVKDAESDTKGTGKELDVYSVGPYCAIYNTFRWDIVDGKVYLSFPDDPSLDTCITDYRLTESQLYGYLGNKENDFCLYRNTDPFDWSTFGDKTSCQLIR